MKGSLALSLLLLLSLSLSVVLVRGTCSDSCTQECCCLCCAAYLQLSTCHPVQRRYSPGLPSPAPAHRAGAPCRVRGQHRQFRIHLCARPASPIGEGLCVASGQVPAACMPVIVVYSHAGDGQCSSCSKQGDHTAQRRLDWTFDAVWESVQCGVQSARPGVAWGCAAGRHKTDMRVKEAASNLLSVKSPPRC